MDEVIDYERDFRRAKEGETLIYTTLHGLKEDLSKPRQLPDLLENALTNSSPALNEEDKESIEKIPNNNADIISSSQNNSSSDEDSESDNNEEEDLDDENSQDEQNKNSTVDIHYRPRDESPNSKKA
jgi:RIO kinase 1